MHLYSVAKLKSKNDKVQGKKFVNKLAILNYGLLSMIKFRLNYYSFLQSSFPSFSACRHETDGRVIIVEFESFLLLNTYAPNNGWKEEENSFQRRRKWDKRMFEFVRQVDKPLIWCGDLNVR